MGEDTLGGLTPEQYLVIGDGPVTQQDRQQIEQAATQPPDTVIEVGHRHCGDLECGRPDSTVKISVTWLDGDAGGFKYKAFIHDEGHAACAQVVRRAQRKIEELLAQRQREGK